MTDYFSELENQLGRATERGIHNQRRRRGRPAGIAALAAIASLVLVSAVVAVVLETGDSHRAQPSTSIPPHAASVSQRHGGAAYCVNSITHKRTPCSPRTAMSPPTQGGFPAITPHPGRPAKLVAQLYLRAPSGAKRPIAAARVIEHGGSFGVTIVGAGLRANTRRDAYAIWLANGRRESRLLGFVNPAVKHNGALKAAGALPTDAFRYHQLLIAIETKPNPRAPGTVVVEGSFHR